MTKSAAPVRAWEVIEQTTVSGRERILRVRVEYENGRTGFLPASFAYRADLDRYIARFHPAFHGKERGRRSCTERHRLTVEWSKAVDGHASALHQYISGDAVVDVYLSYKASESARRRLEAHRREHGC